MRSAFAPFARVVALAAVYVAVARLALLLDAVHGFATLVWPASGIALATIVARRELWPGVWIGAFVVNAWVGASWYVAACIATGNTLEAVVGAYAIRRLAWGRGSVHRLSDALDLVVYAAILSTVLSAATGVASLMLSGVVGPADAIVTARAWWLGDAVGDLVVGGLILTWNETPFLRFRAGRVLESIALVGTLAGLSAWVFFGPATLTRTDLFLESYLLFAPLVWAAVRFGLRGATATTFVVSVLAIAGTALGKGPFMRETLARSLLHLQVFMALVATTGLVLGAAIAERTRAVTARDDVLAIVSHDLQNPLGALKLSVEGAERALGRGGLDLVGRQLAIARRSLGRLEGLVSDLADLAAIDAGRLSIQPALQDAWSLVREAVEGTRASATLSEVTLGEENAPPAEASVVCDRRRVLQVFSNLVGNAVKYTRPGGTVTVGLRLSVTAVEFFVKDTGEGIDPEDLPRVFERFRRGSHNRHPGAGLGLFIAKTIVEAQGGAIEARSQVGVGSTFSFTLPRAHAPGASADGALSRTHGSASV